MLDASPHDFIRLTLSIYIPLKGRSSHTNHIQMFFFSMMTRATWVVYFWKTTGNDLEGYAEHGQGRS